MSFEFILHLLIDIVVLTAVLYYKDYIGVALGVIYGVYKNYNELPEPIKLGKYIDVMIDDEIAIDEYVFVENYLFLDNARAA